MTTTAPPIPEFEDKEYYRSIWRGGTASGVVGVAVGLALTAGLQRYYPPFRTLPFYIKPTFVIFPGMLSISTGANRASHAYLSRIHPELKPQPDEAAEERKILRKQEPKKQQAKDWLYDHQYDILGATWLATMTTVLERMRRDKTTTAARKLVQARVLAQASTLAVLLVTAVLEANDRKAERGKYQRVVLRPRQAATATMR